MGNSVILDKSKKFALRIVKLYKYLNEQNANMYFQHNYAAEQA